MEQAAAPKYIRAARRRKVSQHRTARSGQSEKVNSMMHGRLAVMEYSRRGWSLHISSLQESRPCGLIVH